MDGIILKTNELIFQNNERNGRKGIKNEPN